MRPNPTHTHLTDLEVRDTKYPVYVTPEGMFYTFLPGKIEDERFGNTQTLDDLRQRIVARTRLRTVKVAIEASYFARSTNAGHPEVYPVILTGLHAKDGDVLYRDERTGTAHRLSTTADVLLRRLTPAQGEECVRLARALYEARLHLDKFLADHRLHAHQSARQVVEAAILAKREAQDDAAAPLLGGAKR